MGNHHWSFLQMRSQDAMKSSIIVPPGQVRWQCGSSSCGGRHLFLSMSSSSSSGSSASPEPPSKRRREEKVEDTDDSDDPSSDSEEEEEQNDDDDTPALSHAEKRRQKKKEKLAALKGDTETPPTKKRKLDSGKAAADSTLKRQNSVWVGNMSFKTTPEALRKFFDGVGEITRIHMPMKLALKPNMPAENRG